jgi:hypothetical protein
MADHPFYEAPWCARSMKGDGLDALRYRVLQSIVRTCDSNGQDHDYLAAIEEMIDRKVDRRIRELGLITVVEPD